MEILNEEEGWTSFFCSAHCLQLCLKAGLNINAVDRLISCSQKLVAHFHHSVVATEALKQKQQQMNVEGKKLVRCCATPWNSQLAMLDRLLKLRWPVTAVLSDEEVSKRNDRYLDLKNEQWNLAEDLIKVLEPFSVATSLLSYEENVSVSAVFPILHGLLDQLKSSVDDDAPVIRQFKDKVSKQIKEKWELKCVDVSSPLLLTSALDPRFRQLVFIKLNDFKKEELKEKIVEYMEKFKEELKDQNEASQMSTEPPAKKEEECS